MEVRGTELLRSGAFDRELSRCDRAGLRCWFLKVSKYLRKIESSNSSPLRGLSAGFLTGESDCGGAREGAGACVVCLSLLTAEAFLCF